MLKFDEVIISVESLKQTCVSPEVIRILESVRPEWKAENIRGKVCTCKPINTDTIQSKHVFGNE